ncbi:sigma-54 interaction domain-containing protein [Alkaliphilus hydrothermalis]|uniref:HTH-type transcriptional regulatory protein TyrR n=1 Tax=Alkaliphilus hydrothermalis TaxID=1482730 RepID=A0ABS2NLH3_9FIRM|nr:sigma 54-interacting transcriptional regulator [Alkaliphilus hydrothermalis]MBM7613773.1 transcriptional regulator with PAS, ATPase and Fis domain [Alkaliphilus hydrothermalis]
MKRANVTHLNYNKSVSQEIEGFSYRDLFHNLLDGILIINSTGRVEYVNPSYERMFGVSNFALIGKSIFHVPNDDIVLSSIKNTKKIQGFLSLPIYHKKISASASPLMVDNQYNGIISIYREEALGEVDTIEIYSNTQQKQAIDEAFESITGKSTLLRESLEIASRAAKTLSTVLIIGESGTGKELVAKAIHEAGQHAHKPYIKINCGAIPATLLESELFGHEQGAFTGAVKRKIGKFEQANGGSIFLDEIGDMPLEMQVKLLRVLQEREFERVGGNETIQCNLRIIAATHRNLEELIKEGRFREDLYYRLNVVPVHLPSLKERKEDILGLCDGFMKKIEGKTGIPAKTIDQEVIDAFHQYQWPGNIRELENLMERLMVLVEGDTITLNDIPPFISHIYGTHFEKRADHSLINVDCNGQMATLEDYEKAIIQKALDQFGSFNKAAKALGITHKTVAFKARKYNIID